jgi:RNA recognition motif-containing protein
MKSIFIGPLTFQVTENAVRSLFQPYGTVDKIKLIYDRHGQSRGFGFVEMGNEAEAKRAIAALNGRTLNGRTLNVNEARPRAERASGRGA